MCMCAYVRMYAYLCFIIHVSNYEIHNSSVDPIDADHTDFQPYNQHTVHLKGFVLCDR